MNESINRNILIREALMMCKKAIVLFFIVLLSTLLISCGGGNPVVPSDDEVLDYDEVDTYNNTTSKDGLVIFNLEDVQVEVKVEDEKTGTPLSDIKVDMFLYEGKVAYLIVDPSGDYIPKIIAEEQSYKNYSPQSKIPIISTIVKLIERTEWALEGYTSGGAQFSDQIDNKFLKYLFDYIFQYGGKTTLGDLKYSMEDAIIAGADVVLSTGITVVFGLSGPIGWALIALDVFDMGDTFVVAQWAKKYESLGYSDSDYFEIYYWIPAPYISSIKIPFYPFIVPIGEPGEFMEEEGGVILASPVVSASDGTYNDKVRVTWNNLYPLYYYRVYRSDSLNGIKTALGNWQSSTLYDDYDVISGKIYHYWVICALYSDGTGATSDFGGRDTGYAE